MSISRERVLHALKSGGDRSLHTMEVVAALGFPQKEARKAVSAVRETLEALKSLGLAKELPGSRWKTLDKSADKRGGKGSRVREEVKVRRAERALARRDADRSPEPAAHEAERLGEPRAWGKDTRIGWLAMTTRGFAFVTLDDGLEVFVSPRGLGGALHGDRVRVRVSPSAKGFEGEVVEVVARGLTRVGGTLVRAQGRLYVEPRDPRLPQAFVVEGTLPLETRPGFEVVAQLTRWPEREGELPSVRVLRAMGPRGSAHTEVAKILLRDAIAEEFPEDVTREALAFPPRVDPAEIARREDMRALPILTIDPKDARDHDDAVWAERSKDGYRVVIAIADVSHYVREGTAIDREALVRSCSIYLPDRAIPMLPPELSSNLASLVPDEDRLFLGLEVHLGKTGNVRSYRFVEGAMRSRARLTYEDVARTLGLTEAGEPSPVAEAHRPLLETLLEVSKLLRARRHARGALGFELPEAKILLDTRGEPRDVVEQKGDAGVKRAYELIEDLMLLANETVAEHLARADLPAIFRVHGKPDAGKIAQFAVVAEALGLRLPSSEDPSPKELQAALARIEGTPLEGVLGYLLLRSMQQATYAVTDIGHFALAARHYLHFTSPIRRYPDLAVHRIVRALARREALDGEALRRALLPQAVQSSRMERRSMQIEREVQAIYRCLLMKKHVGEELEGRVTSVAEHGVVVSLTSPFVEVKVPVDRLDPARARAADDAPRDARPARTDYFELDPLGIALVARRSGRRIGLADVARVRIEEASIERREITASWISGGSIGRASRGHAPERASRTPARPARGARADEGARAARSPRGGATKRRR